MLPPEEGRDPLRPVPLSRGPLGLLQGGWDPHVHSSPPDPCQQGVLCARAEPDPACRAAARSCWACLCKHTCVCVHACMCTLQGRKPVCERAQVSECAHLCVQVGVCAHPLPSLTACLLRPQRCKYDTCNCQNSEGCMCAALSSYARACASKGVMLWGWREQVCSECHPLRRPVCPVAGGVSPPRQPSAALCSWPPAWRDSRGLSWAPWLGGQMPVLDRAGLGVACGEGSWGPSLHASR